MLCDSRHFVYHQWSSIYMIIEYLIGQTCNSPSNVVWQWDNGPIMSNMINHFVHNYMQHYLWLYYCYCTRLGGCASTFVLHRVHLQVLDTNLIKPRLELVMKLVSTSISWSHDSLFTVERITRTNTLKNTWKQSYHFNNETVTMHEAWNSHLLILLGSNIFQVEQVMEVQQLSKKISDQVPHSTGSWYTVG